MGGTGRAVAGAFFILVYIAGLTSLVSILEAPVSCAISSLGLSRNKAVWLLVALCSLLGIPAALDIGILENMDAAFAGFGMISGGLLVVLLMGRHDPERFNEDLRRSGSSPLLRKLLLLSLRWLAPAVISIGLIVSIADLHARWMG
jgi:NSS family neurotransmitter:Na+ symporter